MTNTHSGVDGSDPAEIIKEMHLYLEDIFLGQQFISASHQMTAEEIKRFAHQFDPQPFHLDEVAAQD
ncbi:hypothetical protein QN360_20290, partial [Glaciimonas sp. CA11.2]|nr:hypothetical protein [Glaciimonas sp. CA11.2]